MIFSSSLSLENEVLTFLLLRRLLLRLLEGLEAVPLGLCWFGVQGLLDREEEGGEEGCIGGCFG
jgi:hypothetical protein